MDKQIMWIVGKWRGGIPGESIWDINGVFDDKTLAVQACNNDPAYFVGPLTLNESLPDETTMWAGMYYPAHGKQS